MTPEDCAGQNNPAVRVLFGATHARGEESRAGRVYIDDIWLGGGYDQQLQRIPHTSIDRFTGGVRAGVLFEERVIFRGPPIKLAIRVEGLDALEDHLDFAFAKAPQDDRPADSAGRGEAAKRILAAFREAVRDLAEGRLSVGAGGGRGHGYFQIVGDFDAAWRRFAGGGS
ncbi:MAG: hypothetical protein GF355_01995 [Candidatus Eisenbacteria bacterium]|nr:hypothetical protein [Candidatus Eisenbacteria bacterium]